MIGRLVYHFYTEGGVFLSKGGSQLEEKKKERKKERKKKRERKKRIPKFKARKTFLRNINGNFPVFVFLVSRFWGKIAKRERDIRLREAAAAIARARLRG